MLLSLSLEHTEINWSNFNITVSQETGRLEDRERERWGNGRSVEYSEHSQLYNQLSSPFYVGVACGSPKQLQLTLEQQGFELY